MSFGAAYAFDAESYGRFLPPAREAGMAFDDVDFKPKKPGDISFPTILPTRT